MKYIENKEVTKDRFVTGFSVFNNEIKVKFADGGKILVQDNKVNRKKVLDRMDAQALVIAKKESELKKESLKNKKFMPVNISGVAFTAGAIALGSTINSPLSEVCIAAGVLAGVGVGYKALKTINNNKKLATATKIKFAIEQKDYLNNNVRQSKNTLNGVSRKIKKAVRKPNIDGEAIDMNVVNGLSLDELKQLKNNIEREKEFDFIYKTNVNEPEKAKEFRI